MTLSLPLRRWLAVPLFALALTGCDVTGYDDDVEGWYSYGGTLDGEPGYTVNGELRIHSQYRDEAYADFEWYMLEGSREIFEVFAEDVWVDIDSGGRIRFTVRGDLQLDDGRWRDFQLEHEGRLSGSTLRGSWRLETDLPSTDEGRFSARR